MVLLWIKEPIRLIVLSIDLVVKNDGQASIANGNQQCGCVKIFFVSQHDFPFDEVITLSLNEAL